MRTARLSRRFLTHGYIFGGPAVLGRRSELGESCDRIA
jgi:hypothetical protein